MKLAPAIEEFIQYKQALGSSYTTPSRVLKAFLRKTGNVEFDELTAQHAEAFLPGQWCDSYERLVSSVLGARLFLPFRNQPWLHATSNTPDLDP